MKDSIFSSGFKLYVDCMSVHLVFLLLTVVFFQVQSFFAAVKALSRKEVHYGAHATSEQVLSISYFDHQFLSYKSIASVFDIYPFLL